MKKIFLCLAVFMISIVLFGTGQIVYAETDQGLPEVTVYDKGFYANPDNGELPEQVNDGSKTKLTPRKTSDYVPPYYASYIASLKSTYPGTRIQSPYGTCWAFAATACAEFDMVKNHGVAKEVADYSELQLAYFHYNNGNVLEGLEGDDTYLTAEGKNYLTKGGSIYYAMQTLAQWKCYTEESKLPYSKVVSNPDAYISPSFAGMHGSAKLRNAKILYINNDPDSIKKAIMEYGAVAVGYHNDDKYFSEYSGQAYYYNPNKLAKDHDVVIVGWNDTILRTKWPEDNRPPNDGAWIVRNSWTDDPEKINTKAGYFYMSYDDASFADRAYALDFEPNTTADNLYQHDGSVISSRINCEAAANVFTAHETMRSNSEKLDSVMISFTGTQNLEYKIEIYTDLQNSEPDSGYFCEEATTTGYIKDPGIYTVDLNAPVYLEPGEKFSVVVTALNGSLNIDAEMTEEVVSDISGKWFKTVAYVESGESFVYGSDRWFDMTVYEDIGNIRIKAIAVDSTARKCHVKYHYNGGTPNRNNITEYVSKTGGEFILKSPKRIGYHFVGWYTDSDFTEKVTSISYSEKKDHELYARWCSEDNERKTSLSKATLTANGYEKVTCSQCGKEFSKTVLYRPTTVKLSNTKLTYSGSQKSPKPVVKTSAGKTLVSGTDYTLVYSKALRKKVGRYYVNVKFKGNYTGSKKLYFTIVPKAPAKASAARYGSNDIKVSWSKATGATGYAVYYKLSTASKYKLYKNTTSRSMKFPNLKSKKKYNFKIVPYYKYNGTKYKSLQSKVVSCSTK